MVMFSDLRLFDAWKKFQTKYVFIQEKQPV